MELTSRQKHGFLYENKVISKYNLIKSTNNFFDAYTKELVPVQIKCIKYKNSICLGSIKRNMSIDENFILIVGFWYENKDNIIKEYILDIKHTLYNSLLNFDNLDNFLFEIKNITNKQDDDLRWKNTIKKYKSPKTNIIKLNPKRDHHKQKRIQCSIAYLRFIKDFLILFKEINLV
jgi:hypothetical protein